MTGLGRERSRKILPSSLHQTHWRVRQFPEAVTLHIGDPHIGIAEPVREAFVRAIRDGQSHYGDAGGIVPLRERLAASFGGKDRSSVPLEHVFATPGSCQGIAAVLQSLAFEGGVALLPEIHWPMHLQQVTLAGLTSRYYRSDLPASSLVEDLERQYTPEVCVALVNSPSNPAGHVLDAAALEEVYAWAKSRGVWLISDEAYEDFVYEGSRSSLTQLDLARPERERIVFSVHTFSKNHSMTGYRLGYVLAPTAERAALFSRVQEATLVSPCTPVQFAGIAALEHERYLREHVAYVTGTRNAVLDLLAGTGLLWRVPRGGWYALLDLSGCGVDAELSCERLLSEVGVALAPGREFAPPGHGLAPRLARAALCRERHATLDGLRRVVDYCRRVQVANA